MRDKVPRQRGFTVVVRVIDGHVGELNDLLDRIGNEIKSNPHIPFVQLDRLHYSSMIVVEDDPTGPYLLFEGSIDGEVDAFIRHLVAVAADGIGEIFRHCAGYPASGTADREALADYLLAHDMGPGAMFVAWPGRTVTVIREEEELRARIGRFLDDQLATTDLADRPGLRGRNAMTVADVRHRIQEFVRGEPDLAWARKPLTKPFLVRFGPELTVFGSYPVLYGLYKLARTALSRKSSRPARCLAKLTLSGLGAAIGGVLGYLRMQEIRDQRKDKARSPGWEADYAEWSDALVKVVAKEDYQLQNHLASVTQVKPGRFRIVLLKVVFAGIIAAVRLVANRGKLGGITSVHFARWVMTSDDRNVIFLSNFDGSWESYLNDFIDIAAFGLNAVWANTENRIGYPPSKFLIGGGAYEGDRFKAYARYSQVRSRVWYSAYPDLTVENIGNNIAIRDDLFTDLDDLETEAWLRRL